MRGVHDSGIAPVVEKRTHRVSPRTPGDSRKRSAPANEYQTWRICADFVAKALTDRFNQSVLGEGITFAFGCGERSGNARSAKRGRMKTTLGEARCAVDPTVQAFLDQINEPSPVRPTTPAEARAAESRMQDIDVAKLRADIEDGSIPGPSGQIGIRITRPLGAKGELPAVMYFHGGGWVVGDRDTHDRLVRDLAHSAHAAIVFVDYSRAGSTVSRRDRGGVRSDRVGQGARSIGRSGSVAAGRGWRQRWRKHGSGGDAAGENAWRPGDRLPGALLPRR